MTQGVVIFATNNGGYDYESLACWSESRIHRHLGLPVTIISQDTDAMSQRWFDDLGTTVPWYNRNRSDVYDLSPYDETLVLDADYVVCSDHLKAVFHSQQDFLAMGKAYDVTGLNDFSSLNYFGKHRMPVSWATVMFFRRGKLAQGIFSAMQMVRENWEHYRSLYQFERTVYRNDYALSIAQNIMHGHQGHWPAIPWRLATVEPRHRLQQLAPDRFSVGFVTAQSRLRRVTLADDDFHAMCKRDLGDIVASSA